MHGQQNIKTSQQFSVRVVSSGSGFELGYLLNMSQASPPQPSSSSVYSSSSSSPSPLLLLLLFFFFFLFPLPPLHTCPTRATLLVFFCYILTTFTNYEGPNYIIPTIFSIQSRTAGKKWFSKCIMVINFKKKKSLSPKLNCRLLGSLNMPCYEF